MDHDPQIPWTQLAAFVRQHTHDVRNHLNGLDLEAALLAELVEGGEAKASVDRLRRQIRTCANQLRALSSKFSEPPTGRAAVPASMLMLVWQDQAAALEPKPEVAWAEDVGDAKVTVDPESLAQTFRELLVNATSFGSGKPLQAKAEVTDGHVQFTLSEPKDAPVDPSQWTPLKSTRRGGYGLGLWNADRRIEASHGHIERRYDSSAGQLVTTITFPTLSPAQ